MLLFPVFVFKAAVLLHGDSDVFPAWLTGCGTKAWCEADSLSSRHACRGTSACTAAQPKLSNLGDSNTLPYDLKQAENSETPSHFSTGEPFPLLTSPFPYHLSTTHPLLPLRRMHLHFLQGNTSDGKLCAKSRAAQHPENKRNHHRGSNQSLSHQRIAECPLGLTCMSDARVS